MPLESRKGNGDKKPGIDRSGRIDGSLPNQLFDPIVGTESKYFLDPPCTGEGDKLWIFYEFGGLLDQFIVSETVPWRQGRYSMKRWTTDPAILNIADLT